MYHQIFQQLSTENVAADAAPSVSMFEAHSSSLKGLQFEERSRDPSAVTGASILASLSNTQKDSSLLPPPSRKGKGLQTEISDLPSTSEDNHVIDTDMKNASDPNDNGPADVAPSSNKGVNESVDGATHELRPLMRLLAGASTTEFDISKILDERKETDPPISLAARRQTYKDGLQQGILDPDTIEVTFNDFPYYLRCNLLTNHSLFIYFMLIALHCLHFSFLICFAYSPN